MSVCLRTSSIELDGVVGFLQRDQDGGLADAGGQALPLGGIALGVGGEHLVEGGQGFGGLVLFEQCPAGGHARPHLVVGPGGLLEPGVVFRGHGVLADGHQQIAHDFRGLEVVVALGVGVGEGLHHPAGVGDFPAPAQRQLGGREGLVELDVLLNFRAARLPP